MLTTAANDIIAITFPRSGLSSMPAPSATRLPVSMRPITVTGVLAQHSDPGAACLHPLRGIVVQTKKMTQIKYYCCVYESFRRGRATPHERLIRGADRA
ncbi:hypothetical protein ACFS32_04075 [Novosphingobium pokkalii]|uniref:hypothetical protein n=1 Tax=Novosphingobium pokkalii TaxID=1770194 RepID=UPI00362B0ABC